MLLALLIGIAQASYQLECEFAVTVTDVVSIEPPLMGGSHRVEGIYLGIYGKTGLEPQPLPSAELPTEVYELPRKDTGCRAGSGMKVSFLSHLSAVLPAPGSVVSVHYSYSDGMTSTGVQVSASWSIKSVVSEAPPAP